MMQRFIKHSIILILSLSTAVAGLPAFSTEAEPIYYSDCAYIEFEDIDSSTMTREEQLAALDADFEDSLNASETCMTDAVSSNAEKLANAGGNSGSNGQGSNTGAGQATQTATASQTTQSAQDQSTTPPSREHVTGGGQQGSSAVCDAVKQGYESATTENEKKHFQELMTEYGCR
ncbi:hypothetical protein [Salinimonas chungwhensis]|uniref:hypothetical protein n=1 Tax=Salinimonas chungwhensis TaxID=265425 RepID=UPI0003A8F131|nr:hypothetical protein [Salinimonas chungwhensis]